jgi:sporulation protein YlmC with PRC-barrel domain
MISEVFERDEVTLGQVKDMDIVTDGGSVRGIVVCEWP